MDFSTATTGTTNMNPPEFTVDDLDEMRRLSMVILADMTRIAVDETDVEFGLSDDEISALSETLNESIYFISGLGPLPRCIEFFTRQIQKADGNASNIAELVPYSQNGEPYLYIAPTAFDVTCKILKSLSWMFFDSSPQQVRSAFSAIEFDWNSIHRLNARMEREVSILPQQFGATAGAAQAGAQAAAGAAQAGAQLIGATGATATPVLSNPLLVTYRDFQNITKTQLSSGHFDGGVARSTLYKKLPELHQPTQTAGREKLWRYEDIAAAWNRARNRPEVPATEEAARAMLRDPKRVKGR